MDNCLRVLFLCTGNSARSQMAEAILRHFGGNRFESHSAGLDPKGINPHTLTVMQEAGYSLDGQTSKDVKVYLGRQAFDYVITLCDHVADHCPTNFPGPGIRLHWAFPDPAAVQGDPDSQLAAFRNVRDAISARVEQWLAELQTEVLDMQT